MLPRGNTLSILVALMMVVSSFGSPSSVAREISGDSLLQRIERRYREISSLSGEFTQVIPLKGMGITRVGKGRFYIMKPWKSRWDYVTPRRQTFITDGKVLYYRRGEESSFRKSSINSLLLGLYGVVLGGGGKVGDFFYSSHVEVTSPSHFAIEMVPSGKYRNEVKRVVLFWNGEKELVEKLVIFSITGTSNSLTFTHMKVNTPLPDRLFMSE